MKKSIIIWTIAIILVIVAVYTTNNYNNRVNTAKNPTRQNSQTGQATPTPAGNEQSGGQSSAQVINLMKDYDFTLEDLKGNKVTLSELQGKKVFLNFWATWCPPCKAEMPDIEKLYQETKDSDLIILAVNIGEDKKTVQDFITKNNYNFTVLLDVKGEISELYQVSSIPTSYFIDTNGLLVDGKIGSMPYESMRENVDALK